MDFLVQKDDQSEKYVRGVIGEKDELLRIVEISTVKIMELEERIDELGAGGGFGGEGGYSFSGEEGDRGLGLDLGLLRRVEGDYGEVLGKLRELDEWCQVLGEENYLLRMKNEELMAVTVDIQVKTGSNWGKS